MRTFWWDTHVCVCTSFRHSLTLTPVPGHLGELSNRVRYMQSFEMWRIPKVLWSGEGSQPLGLNPACLFRSTGQFFKEILTASPGLQLGENEIRIFNGGCGQWSFFLKAPYVILMTAKLRATELDPPGSSSKSPGPISPKRFPGPFLRGAY